MRPKPQSPVALKSAGPVAVFVSLELSRATWLVSSLLPGSQKISKHTITGGDGSALLVLLDRLRQRAGSLVDGMVSIIVIQEAGLDGFWVHRLLQANGIESHVVDPASVAVARRRRRAKTDSLDGETLLRTLLAWKRDEPRVCSMVFRRRPSRRMIAGYRVSVRPCCRSGSATSIGSKVCWPARASNTTRCTRIGSASPVRQHKPESTGRWCCGLPPRHDPAA